jgi:hypothetical protein
MMDKPRVLILIAIGTIIFFAGNCVCAQHETTPVDNIDARFERMDIDQDGMLSRAEYMAYYQRVAEARFSWIDMNGDGFATRNEHKEGFSELLGKQGDTKKGSLD